MTLRVSNTAQLICLDFIKEIHDISWCKQNKNNATRISEHVLKEHKYTRNQTWQWKTTHVYKYVSHQSTIYLGFFSYPCLMTPEGGALHGDLNTSSN